MNARQGFFLPSAQLIEEALQLKRAPAAERSLHQFVKHFAWPVLNPGREFLDNWHLAAIAEHLEAVTAGQIARLIINMPFRNLKSTYVSHAWPVWEWIRRPQTQWLTGSYALKVSVRDAVESRRIIQSPIFQRQWTDKFAMTGDQNVKSHYENDRRGHRFVIATDATATGFGGDKIVIDDPISAADANSEAHRLAANEWIRGTVVSRLNNEKSGAIVLVQQRLHDNDPTGVLLKETPGLWETLILPMRHDPKIISLTSLGFKDPRTEPGELLHPARNDEAAVARMEAGLGQYHTQAQLQQRPLARGGGVFDSATLVRIQPAALGRIVHRKVFGDTALKTAERHDYTVFECWGKLADGRIVLLDLVRGKWEGTDLLQCAYDFWLKHASVSGDGQTLRLGALRSFVIEDAASGTGLIQQFKRGLVADAGGVRPARAGDAGVVRIPVTGIKRTKDKTTRFLDAQPHLEAGSVCVLDGQPWLSDLTLELDRITKDDTHDHDDQADPMCDAIDDMLARTRSMYDEAAV